MSRKETSVIAEKDKSGRPVIAKATVRLENLRQGSSTNAQVRKNMPEDHVAGHIIAKLLGGSGADPDNIIPMLKRFNNGGFKSFEQEIRWWLEDIHNGKLYLGSEVEARLKLSFDYKDESTTVPHHIHYLVDFHNAHGKSIHTITGSFIHK